VERPDGVEAALPGLIEPASFMDPAARAIAAVVLPLLAAERDFAAGQVMALVAEPGLRGVVADLYLEGERRLAAAPEVELFREAAAAFLRLVDQQRYERELEALRQRASGGEGSGEALTEMLQRRRRQGYIPAAMPWRGRT
jgi:hypothetical protein